MICPSCSTENRPLAKFCRFCGAALPEQTPQIVQSFSSSGNSAESEAAPNLASDLSGKAPDSPDGTDIIALTEIRSQLENFINTLLIRQKQKKIGMPVVSHTNVLVFRGETGTGKSLVAEWFIGQLQKSGCLSGTKIERTTLHKLQRLYQYDVDISKYLSEQKLAVLLVDEIQTDQTYLNELLLGLTEKPSETICILLGIREGLEKFFEEKSELSDLVSFYDFPAISDENLTKILEKKLRDGGFEFDDDVKKSFSACVQEAKHNENAVYKNGWIVEKDILRKIMEKQAARLSKKANLSANDLKRITAEDLPVNVKMQSVEEILSMLDELVGMEAVKKAIRELCQTIQNNQKRAALGLKVENPKPHIILTGNPGTGKTTVTRFLGKLFHAMHLLPSDKVLETSGLDLTAGYVGQTKDKVNELCDRAMGGVLFVDEAYYLAGPDGGSYSFATEAVGTLLKRMEDGRGKFIVVAAGYQNEMKDFMKMNPGLESRFGSTIHIDDYSADELYEILCLNVKKSQFVFAEDAEKVAREAVTDLCKNKGKDFANARAVRNLFDRIKLNMDSRITNLPENDLTMKTLTTILPSDIPHEDKKTLTVEDVFAELNELVGMGKVKKAVRELYDTVKINAELEKIGAKAKRPEIHIALTGNPGTGKTTVARILGKLFCTMGLLTSDKVIECDRSKIVAKYVGHTAQNVQRLCDDATGGILFIDEVYALSSDDFGREATDTLMKRMEDDRGKFVVVVAGYADKMNEWMAVNEGLSSRFTHRIHLDDYDANELYELFLLYARKEGLSLTEEAMGLAQMVITNISQNRGHDFANGRTIRKLFDSVVRKKNSRVIRLDEAERTKNVLTTIEACDFDFTEES